MNRISKAYLSFILTLTILFGILPAASVSVSAANAPMSGIDVSAWQETINWSKVKATGVDFAFLRICSYSSSSHSYTVDSYFDSNVRGATAQGIHLGAYFFSYAKSLNEVKNEARMVVNILNNYPGKFAFPIVFDAESNNIKSFAADACVAFCDILEENGYYAMIYANAYWFNEIITPASKISQYDLWLASYFNKYTGYTPSQSEGLASSIPSISANSGNVKIWQYSQSGSVSGISGGVDMNVCTVDYSQIIPVLGFNGYAHEHSYGSTYYHDDNGHYQICSKCNRKSEVVAHTLVNNFNVGQHWQECFCGYFANAKTHTKVKAYTDAGHYTYCACGYQSALTDHTMVTAYTDDGHYSTCNCGYQTQVVPHSLTVHYDEEMHYSTCDCGYQSENQAHDMQNGSCTGCGYTTVLRGDVNESGTVNSADALYLLRSTLNTTMYPLNQSADMNGDGKSNSADALYLLRHTILPDNYPLSE